MKSYTNDTLRFLIQYPSYLNEVQEGSDRVIFRIKDDPGMGGSGFSVLTEKVSYNTTEEWLQAQPKGAAKDGIDKVVWLDRSDEAFTRLIVSRYVVSEYDEDHQPVYRKGLFTICVNNGMLYEIPLTPSESFDANEEPFISADEVALAVSLYVW
jgi:hypothetical protein